MKTLLTVLVALASPFAATTPGHAQSVRADPDVGGGLRAFRSDRELRAYLRKLAGPEQDVPAQPLPMPSPPVAEAPSVSSAPVAVAEESGEEVVLTGARIAPKITNTQEADVDEGGIVKVRGDTLVILRRGRLFTVAMGGGALKPVDAVNAFPPGVSGRGDWYDEMLLSDDLVIVVGYSYARGGTEINRFRLDDAGRLTFVDAHHLRSDDYYSSRNYASRLIGTKLVFYAPLYLNYDNDPLDALPGLSRWSPGSKAAFKRIARSRRVFIPDALRRSEDANVEALHSVTTCDLSRRILDCDATVVLGPESRNFYVSGRAVYLWLSDAFDDREDGPNSLLVRLPLDGARPSAVQARGSPVDQFSFREDRDEGVLNVFLDEEDSDDAMWAAERPKQDAAAALLRVPLRLFGTGSREVPLSRYRPLPLPRLDGGSLRNRFVGGHLLYGLGGEAPADVMVAPVRGGPVARLTLPHGVDRLEPLGRDALVVGSGAAGLGLSAVDLNPGRSPVIGDRYTLPNAAEGESRSHAFFFSPDDDAGASGTLGLPIRREAAERFEEYFSSSAAMLFVRRDRRRFSPAGELDARPEPSDDACQASCVDWYGNARPIFLSERVFALLGYELVEGRLADGRIQEVRRVDFSPPPAKPGR